MLPTETRRREKLDLLVLQQPLQPEQRPLALKALQEAVVAQTKVAPSRPGVSSVLTTRMSPTAGDDGKKAAVMNPHFPPLPSSSAPKSPTTNEAKTADSTPLSAWSKAVQSSKSPSAGSATAASVSPAKKPLSPIGPRDAVVVSSTTTAAPRAVVAVSAPGPAPSEAKTEQASEQTAPAPLEQQADNAGKKRRNRRKRRKSVE